MGKSDFTKYFNVYYVILDNVSFLKKYLLPFYEILRLFYNIFLDLKRVICTFTYFVHLQNQFLVIFTNKVNKKSLSSLRHF